MRAEHAVSRALSRLAVEGAVLAQERCGRSFGVFADGDRRRRPLVRLPAEAVRALCGDGTLSLLTERNVYVLSEAGRAYMRRSTALPAEAFRAQHDDIENRVVADEEGGLRPARGVHQAGPMARLARMTDAAGKPFFSETEIAAGRRLRADWEAGQQGLLRGSDWSAPPRGSASRTGGGGLENARIAAIDARRRCEEALEALGAQAARAVRGACLNEMGFDALERSAGWPQRSGKVALKFALEQLAAHYRAR